MTGLVDEIQEPMPVLQLPKKVKTSHSSNKDLLPKKKPRSVWGAAVYRSRGRANMSGCSYHRALSYLAH